MTTKIAIFGTGGVGCVHGYILHAAGAEITAICRSNYEAIRDNGITIKSDLWKKTVGYRPHATAKSVGEAALQGPFDYVLVCSKSFPHQAHLIHDIVSPSTAIVLVQNGIGIEDEYAQMYRANTIISAVVWLPAIQISPGFIKMGASDRIELGPYPSTITAKETSPSSSNPNHGPTERLAALFSAGGGHAPTFADIQVKRWTKLAINATFNPLCALTRVDEANLLLSSPDADALIVKIIKEIGRVAQATHGYAHLVDDKFVDETLRYHRGLKETGGRDPSSLTDVKNGRPVEVDAFLGNVVALAKTKNVEVPVLDCLYTLLVGLNFGITRPSGSWKEPQS